MPRYSCYGWESSGTFTRYGFAAEARRQPLVRVILDGFSAGIHVY